MRDLILFMSRRVAGEEAESLARETQEWIESNLDPGCDWPGNYRELEQCVRNILIRKEYQTARSASRPGAMEYSQERARVKSPRVIC